MPVRTGQGAEQQELFGSLRRPLKSEEPLEFLAVVSGLLVATYAGAVFLLQTALGGVIQGQTVAVAGSTLLAAALFQPLRRRVQSLVDRRFDRARYDGERTASDFTERLRDEVDVDHLKVALATTAAGVVHPTGADVWLRPALGPKA